MNSKALVAEMKKSSMIELSTGGDMIMIYKTLIETDSIVTWSVAFEGSGEVVYSSSFNQYDVVKAAKAVAKEVKSIMLELTSN